jgi:hypothetical protein
VVVEQVVNHMVALGQQVLQVQVVAVVAVDTQVAVQQVVQV